MNSKALLHFKFFNTALFLGKSESLIERQRARLVENSYFNFSHFFDMIEDENCVITCEYLKQFCCQSMKLQVTENDVLLLIHAFESTPYSK